MAQHQLQRLKQDRDKLQIHIQRLEKGGNIAVATRTRNTRDQLTRTINELEGR